MSDYSRFEELLRGRMAGVMELEVGQVRALFEHWVLMVRWNKGLNLTRIVDLEEAVERHYVESLMVAARLPAWIQSVVDIGSGAGFPGFPVAVGKPDLKVTVVESDQRKAAFLREAGDLVRNMVVKPVRAEVLEGAWDGVISRAVRPKEVLRVGKRVGKWVGLLVSEADAVGLKWGGAVVVAVGQGGVLWMANVPRET
ncbi:MAG: class I SAM-dependent methyltransferase [Acidobacteria bacterium]|nr:class I SAM-dependent methyltransferase [Acidobacteriota bacterium]